MDAALGKLFAFARDYAVFSSARELFRASCVPYLFGLLYLEVLQLTGVVGVPSTDDRCSRERDRATAKLCALAESGLEAKHTAVLDAYIEWCMYDLTLVAGVLVLRLVRGHAPLQLAKAAGIAAAFHLLGAPAVYLWLHHIAFGGMLEVVESGAAARGALLTRWCARGYGACLILELSLQLAAFVRHDRAALTQAMRAAAERVLEKRESPQLKALAKKLAVVELALETLIQARLPPPAVERQALQERQALLRSG